MIAHAPDFAAQPACDQVELRPVNLCRFTVKVACRYHVAGTESVHAFFLVALDVQRGHVLRDETAQAGYPPHPTLYPRE